MAYPRNWVSHFFVWNLTQFVLYLIQNNYDMRILSIILIIAMALGCSTSKEIRKQNRAGKKIERIKAEFPQLFRSDTTLIISKDTFRFVSTEFRFDTVMTAADTMIITTEKFINKVEVIRDLITNEIIKYKFNTVVLPDTFYVERIDTNYIVNREIVTKTEYKNKIPWWIWVVIVVLVAWIVRGFYFKYFG